YAIPDSVVTLRATSLQGITLRATRGPIEGLQPRDVWYVGGITDENAREVTVKLDFLNPGLKYEAVIYADAKDADGLPGDTYKPQAYTITKKKVTAKTVLKIRMARCGGFAISIREVKAGE
ncbi:MAG: glycoside hydrolase family 97 C-terminal domain-containing protein, partial [Bacteroidales bacterium]|nr:glycoside hydrolase family 97 C-terminal domain-containing protein [Bacteroidales bacterium]